MTPHVKLLLLHVDYAKFNTLVPMPLVYGGVNLAPEAVSLNKKIDTVILHCVVVSGVIFVQIAA
jgi:hypothetical protein